MAYIVLIFSLILPRTNQQIVLLLQPAAKIRTITPYSFKRLDFKSYGSTEFLTLRPLVALLHCSGATDRDLGYTFCRLIAFKT